MFLFNQVGNQGLDIFMQILGYLGAVGIAVFSSPQLISLIKTRDTRHVNSYLFGLLALASLFFMVSGFYSFAQQLDRDGMNTGAAFQLAVSIANFFSGSIAGLVLLFKLVNKINAKKNNMTEAEYCDKLAKEIADKKAQKPKSNN